MMNINKPTFLRTLFNNVTLLVASVIDFMICLYHHYCVSNIMKATVNLRIVRVNSKTRTLVIIYLYDYISDTRDDCFVTFEVEM